MTVRPFMAILPKQTQIGDEIILKGRVKDNAQMWVYILIIIVQVIDVNDDRESGIYIVLFVYGFTIECLNIDKGSLF